MARHRRFSPPSRPTSPLPPWPTPRPAGGPSTGSRLAGRAPGHSAGCSRRAASTGETIRPPARCRRGLKALPNEVLQPVDSMLQCRAIYKEEGNQRTESQLHVRKTWQACGQHANGPEWPTSRAPVLRSTICGLRRSCCLAPRDSQSEWNECECVCACLDGAVSECASVRVCECVRVQRRRATGRVVGRADPRSTLSSLSRVTNNQREFNCFRCPNPVSTRALRG